MPDREASRIQGLGELILAAKARGEAPIASWNPPYCGDIGLEIHRDGSWSYQGTRINRLQLVKLFARVLHCEADGRHYLVTPAEKVDVAVADAPFLAIEMQVDGAGGEQRLTFRTNIDDIVVCGLEHPLSFQCDEGSGGLKPYVVVRGRLMALLTRSLYLDLVALAEPADEKAEQLIVRSNGVAFPLEPSAPQS